MKLLNWPKNILSTPGKLYLPAIVKASCWTFGMWLQLVNKWGSKLYSSIRPAISEPSLFKAKIPLFE